MFYLLSSLVSILVNQSENINYDLVTTNIHPPTFSFQIFISNHQLKRPGMSVQVFYLNYFAVFALK